MSFPPPIIPQTAEQAIARDQIAGLDAVRLDDPRAELERLRQAIREHRSTTLSELTEGDTLKAAVRDRKLWNAVGESA